MVPASAVGISESPPLAIAVSGGGWEEDEAIGRRGESAVGRFLHCFFFFLSLSLLNRTTQKKKKKPSFLLFFLSRFAKPRLL
jgi:hypothetical protein